MAYGGKFVVDVHKKARSQNATLNNVVSFVLGNGWTRVRCFMQEEGRKMGGKGYRNVCLNVFF